MISARGVGVAGIMRVGIVVGIAGTSLLEL
jgi:hypothetical protein